MKTILLLSLFLFAVPAHAVTYQWLDDGGTVNFAENLGSVPKKHRKNVKVLGVDDSSAPQVMEVEDGAKEKPRGEAGRAALKDEPALKDDRKKPITYGGKDAAAWKTEYKKLNGDVKAAEEQLDHLKARLSDSSKMSRTEYLTIQHSIKNTEVRLTSLRSKLDAFNASAAKAEVPPDYKE